MELITASLALTAGIGFSAGLMHLSAGSRRAHDQVHLLFALVCFMASGYAFSDIFWYKALSISSVALSGKVAMTFGIVLDIAILWFAFSYTGFNLKLLRSLFTAIFLVLIVYNLISPFGIQYQTIANVEPMSLPWGEKIGVFDATNNPGLNLLYLVTFLMCGCIFWCCYRQYHSGQKRSALLLVVGMLFYLITHIWDLLIDVSITNYIYLSEYSWIPMILIMSTELSSKRWNVELQQALKKVKKLSGLLPICSSCKRVRNDEGYWTQIESYIRDRSEADFSHGICPECAKKFYPDYCDE